MQPNIGTILFYRFNAADVEKMRFTANSPVVGQVAPLLVAFSGDSGVNGPVFLDGDILYVRNVLSGNDNGQWNTTIQPATSSKSVASSPTKDLKALGFTPEQIAATKAKSNT